VALWWTLALFAEARSGGPLVFVALRRGGFAGRTVEQEGELRVADSRNRHLGLKGQWLLVREKKLFCFRRENLVHLHVVELGKELPSQGEHLLRIRLLLDSSCPLTPVCVSRCSVAWFLHRAESTPGVFTRIRYLELLNLAVRSHR
jgi:hypothetical protein